MQVEPDTTSVQEAVDILTGLTVFFLPFRYPYLSILCSVLGDCCSVAGVGLEELRYFHLECIERGKSKNITVPCVWKPFFVRVLQLHTQSHDLSRRPWPIKAEYTRPAETCLAARLPASSSLSGCYEQRFVPRLKLATVVSCRRRHRRHAHHRETCKFGQHRTAQHMYYPCARSGCWQ